MARTLDPAAHTLRRDSFIDVAQRLITSRGYEQMSIQDVLDELGASKGAFYHYFDSKAALLDAVVERMVVGATAVMAPIIDDPELRALDKLRTLFATMGQWKWERSELVLALLRVWRADENAIVREKFRRRTTAVMAPMFTAIVAQGNAEGDFSADAPEHTARVLMAILMSTNETAVDLFLARQAGTISLDDVQAALTAYPEACERLLGLPAGAFPFIDGPTLRAWFG